LLAAKYGGQIFTISKDQVLSVLVTTAFGSLAGVIANVTMAVACLSTSIALTVVFADYLSHEMFLGRIRYLYALLITISVTFAMTNLGFDGIAQVIEPIVVRLYPSLIMLSLVNIAYVLWEFKHVKQFVFGTFFVTLALNYFL
jgi:LIVCS family branched-chain amino acid:cation transporter